jgi:hypothetical protein
MSWQCDPEIFSKGHCLTVLMEQPGPMPDATLDRICAHLTAQSGGKVRFAWHPQGGRPMLLYLGDYEVAKATYMAEGAFLRYESE